MRAPAQERPWLETLVASLGSRQLSPQGEPLPAFPDEQTQRNTTGLAGRDALAQAHAFYEDAVDALGRAGRTLQAGAKVLDFGFGWGRISRVFMKDVRMEDIHGVDVDPEFVALTRRLFRGGHFESCHPYPPTRHADDTFDLVYAYSVFSHLSEKATRDWMLEFHRILKPGGVVVFTTRHESFFDYCAWAAGQPNAEGYLAALGRLFPDIERARERYRRGELVHATSEGVGGGGARDSSFYGETWIPEAYVRNGLGTGLQFVAGYFDPARYDQASFALRKP